MMEARPVSSSQVTMTEMVLPSHTNALNSVFGGVIMSWIDIAAAIAGQRHASRPVVTASIDNLIFHQPVYVGWIVILKASVNFVAKTSMEIGVHVEAQNSITSESFNTAHAYLTFVALNDNGQPTEVPPLRLETEAERRRFEEAKIRRQYRLELRERIQSSRSG